MKLLQIESDTNKWLIYEGIDPSSLTKTIIPGLPKQHFLYNVEHYNIDDLTFKKLFSAGYIINDYRRLRMGHSPALSDPQKLLRVINKILNNLCLQ